MVRTSWFCKCEEPLYIDVPADKKDAVLGYVDQVSHPGTVSVSPVSSTPPSTAETSRTVLLVVWHGFTRGRSSSSSCKGIKLAHVEFTTVGNDETLFYQIRAAYRKKRGPRTKNPFLVPKAVEYVKFNLVRLNKSGECVGNYKTNSIPSFKEVEKREYAYSPCSPLIGPMPIQSHLFMHSFLNPGDHSRSLAVQQLPKKVGTRLACTTDHTNGNTNAIEPPFGWGIYIVEGLNVTLIVWLLGAGLLSIFLLATVWATAYNDVQAGMGVGQFALAFLTLLLMTAAVKETNTLPSFG
ncbi:HET-like protein [Apiospora arundinis]|uniref:HET-like protein n=1 Tax=Apiospora arundinis TaxID=335852 RepID=A0ABR2IB19_9PEZI